MALVWLIKQKPGLFKQSPARICEQFIFLCGVLCKLIGNVSISILSIKSKHTYHTIWLLVSCYVIHDCAKEIL